jgi:RNA polymerase sigma-70 factor (ECF subfamily)
VSGQTTTALLEAARSGSQEALNQLLERLAGRLLAYIRVRMGASLRARVESRDILQVTLLKAFTSFDQLAAGNSRALMGWLTRIAANEIRDQASHHRRRRRDMARDLPLADAEPHELAQQLRSFSSRLVLEQELAALERALDAVSDSHREVILLRYFEGCSFKQIGERLGRSPDACRMLLARAMAAVALKLGAET